MMCADPALELEALLNRGIGLDVQSIGSSMVALAVRVRMKKRAIKNIAEYAGLAAGSEAEFQSLVEEIVVPETWFFRDREAFAILGQWAAKEWLPKHPYEVLRIISMPCSTGEEPYSIVMSLLDAGLPPERFSVEAVDISAAALAKARGAQYSRNSFRGQSLDFQEKYFTKTATSWQLSETVSSQVQFRQWNVLEAPSRKASELDVIFCRNMMIYFDEKSRTQLMRRLGEMLSPEGLLFLGHAEGGIAREFGFEPIVAPMTFAFRKGQPQTAAKPVSKRREPKKNILRPTVIPVLLPVVPPAARRAKTPQPATPPPSPEALLAKAQKLADAGKLDAAQVECEACIRMHGSSSSSYYLLGLIHNAGGNETQAEEFYRKTLYLEPDHFQALFHLSLLVKKSGDLKKACQLEERAKRAQAKSTLGTKAP
ncbi:MAG: protein-glutamate O-methyltransferase CheR [Verrucomicrobia bacterium]|nr:protein-glutamate O-methyltransferase CheR [Verrucomicrobiota bacterium]